MSSTPTSSTTSTSSAKAFDLSHLFDLLSPPTTTSKHFPARKFDSYTDIANSFRDIIAPAPAIDLDELKDGSIEIRADLPGMNEEDINIDVNRDTLKISGHRTTSRPTTMPTRGCFLYERTFGDFSRVVQLPFAPNPENVTASYSNGVLVVNVPNETKPAGRIPVRRV